MLEAEGTGKGLDSFLSAPGDEERGSRPHRRARSDVGQVPISLSLPFLALWEDGVVEEPEFVPVGGGASREEGEGQDHPQHDRVVGVQDPGERHRVECVARREAEFVEGVNDKLEAGPRGERPRPRGAPLEHLVGREANRRGQQQELSAAELPVTSEPKMVTLPGPLT